MIIDPGHIRLVQLQLPPNSVGYLCASSLENVRPSLADVFSGLAASCPLNPAGIYYYVAEETIDRFSLKFDPASEPCELN